MTNDPPTPRLRRGRRMANDGCSNPSGTQSSLDNKLPKRTLNGIMKPARFSYAVLAGMLILVGFLQLGAPLLALLFSYFVLTKLSRFIPNKWLTLALFIIVVAGIAYTAGHFTRAAIVALPNIADKS